MFGSDIGMSNIEEINILHEGANYGWMAREGTFENGRWRGGDLDQVFALPEDVRNGKNKDAYTYPVAMFDHGDGVAVSAGFAYHGKIEQLQGKFVFGDIQNGRVFVSDLAAMKKADLVAAISAKQAGGQRAPKAAQQESAGESGGEATERLQRGVAKQLKLKNPEQGLMVLDVLPGSPAAEGAIQVDDILLEINGHQVFDSSSMLNLISELKPNKLATLQIARNQKVMNISVMIGLRPSAEIIRNKVLEN